MQRAFVIVLAGLVNFQLLALAQAPAGSNAAVPSVPAVVAAPKLAASKAATKAATSKPAWVDLSAPQQQALKPLAAAWNSISEPQKRKWLEVSKNYPSLAPADQATMHSRMIEWVAMSPQQRAVARLNFAKTKELSNQLTPDQKKAKWETYQALSPEEKATLAAKASPKPAGAATAVKPVPVQKLAATPKSAPSTQNTPSLPNLPALPKVQAGTAVTTSGEAAQGAVLPSGKTN